MRIYQYCYCSKGSLGTDSTLADEPAFNHSNLIKRILPDILTQILKNRPVLFNTKE